MAYIELLEIDESAGANLIAERLRDRYKYFTTLVSTAPTAQLKAIYQKKLAGLQSLAGQHAVDLLGSKASAPTPIGQASNLEDSTVNQQALLVLHTEGRPLRSYPLVPGVNILGRNQGTSGQTILIDDDYMSRSHAVVEVVSIKNRSALLYDIGELPGHKPSTNGVYLNGNDQRLKGKVPIKPNDTLQVGYAKLVLTYAAHSRQNDVVTEIGKKQHSRTVFIKMN